MLLCLGVLGSEQLLDHRLELLDLLGPDLQVILQLVILAVHLLDEHFLPLLHRIHGIDLRTSFTPSLVAFLPTPSYVLLNLGLLEL